LTTHGQALSGKGPVDTSPNSVNVKDGQALVWEPVAKALLIY